MKLILLLIILSSNLYSQSKLSIPESIDLGIVPVPSYKNFEYEVKNLTNDTFFIENVECLQFKASSFDNWLSSFELDNSFSAPILILPKQSIYFNFEIYASIEDSLSKNNIDLICKFRLSYVKYGTNKLLKDSTFLKYKCKTIKDSIFIVNSGLRNSERYCPEDLSNRVFADFLSLVNNFDKPAILDSLKWYGGDSLFNFYGLVKGNGGNIPTVINDSIPYKINQGKSCILGFYCNTSKFYEKKAYINAYLTMNDKKIVLFDSISIKIQPKHPLSFYINTFDYFKTKVNVKINVKEKMYLDNCSDKNFVLDSVTFNAWEKEELQIYSDFDIPINIEKGFGYYLNLNFKPKKPGVTKDKIYLHFKDENGNYLYRYNYLKTIVDDINDVELSKENPLAFYPNPVHSLATLLLDEEPSVGEQVGIYNSLGTLVKTFEVNNKYTQVNTEGFAEGVYIARLLWSGKSVKFCVVR
ncbi:MAG: T9SS type A sorting domain-containing protein [Candidatus Kapabacteria bacterium]|nr:T9SS type A sorting domain-containing protein [Candidatus Kapabacteria bacterium]